MTVKSKPQHDHLEQTHVITAFIAGCGLGLVANLAIPVFSAEVDLAYRVGLVCWYATLGGCTGLLHHHYLNLSHERPHPLPDWITAALLCAWGNLLLVLLAFDSISPVTALAFNTPLPKACWVIEGAAVGPAITGLSKQLSDHTGMT
jgi:hypothetical protein